VADEKDKANRADKRVGARDTVMAISKVKE
jgi:hypothetical protein